MIELSARAQKGNGKIPTVILPEIDRKDDIDINCYFMLRTLRFCRYHDDKAFLSTMWPSLVRAANFLPIIDDDNVGVPQQHSFWGDWKDVRGVEQRKYSPHASLLYMAALAGMVDATQTVGDGEMQSVLQDRLHKARHFVDGATQDGGFGRGSITLSGGKTAPPTTSCFRIRWSAYSWGSSLWIDGPRYLTR